MATAVRQIKKKTFDPEKNYFNCEWVTVKREETLYEQELFAEAYKWSRRGFLTLFIGLFGGFLVLTVFGSLGSILNPYLYWGCLPGGIMAFCGALLPSGYFWEKEHESHYAYLDWQKEHEEELWAEATKEVRAYNEEQERIAEAWRTEHPLEEKIRACLLDPKSSVDVANLARYYAEVYLKEKENEVVD